MATLGVEQIEAVADKGYFKIEKVEACEKAGITAYLPKPVRGPAVREGFFTKDAFRFDPEKNIYTCPAGQTLTPTVHQTPNGPPRAHAEAVRSRNPRIRSFHTVCLIFAQPGGPVSFRKRLSAEGGCIDRIGSRAAPFLGTSEMNY